MAVEYVHEVLAVLFDDGDHVEDDIGSYLAKAFGMGRQIVPISENLGHAIRRRSRLTPVKKRQLMPKPKQSRYGGRPDKPRPTDDKDAHPLIVLL